VQQRAGLEPEDRHEAGGAALFDGAGDDVEHRGTRHREQHERGRREQQERNERRHGENDPGRPPAFPPRPRAAQSAVPLGVELEVDEPDESEPEDSFFSLLFASCLSAPDLADASISRLRLDVP
jgi:hypothetical protein